ncbi:sulfatase-like hydrolase/transferase [Variovorax sp. J22R24]|uniref:sulfatase-like hydrolase/transferase n=1 Tax=Variovorax gracilis TaxID=3053502 RepID=UPI002578EA93|nr:sulfatase-like hydrolase/transferase [Variovorax sp. J22R24]MDM0108709.1 sulfatase-like hydrolase/transferase [Variovorax sp. J22R24]
MEQHNDPQGAREASAPMANRRHGGVRLIDCVWGAILLIPALTIFSSTHVWDLEAVCLLAATAVFYGLLRAILGLRVFLVLTYVPALFGVLAVGADLLRDVNLLEAALIRPDPHEAWPVIQPHAPWIALIAVLLAVPIWVSFRTPSTRTAHGRWPSATLVTITVAAVTCGAVFHDTVLRAWPLNVISVAAASAIGHDEFISTASPYAPTNPRSASASWGASRMPGLHSQNETYILIIGESVRADRLGACGGQELIGISHQDAIIYCDMTSGSSSTHTSVPLLISREMPGGAFRVSRDATFMKAFEEAGFHTYWLAVQERGIAWPDANTDLFVTIKRTDRESLLPSLRSVLAQNAPKKLIVVHAYGAHFSYCDRYEPATAALQADCSKLSELPGDSTLPDFIRAYDNAVAESLRFVDAVISEAAQAGGSSFVMYTADHGENLLDDGRKLFQHALKDPTRWDTTVPAVMWASDEWRSSNPARWERLRANRAAKAMHADLVPTLLGSAAIRYLDERRVAIDLGAMSPAADRTRWVMRRLGEKINGDQLRQAQLKRQ